MRATTLCWIAIGVGLTGSSDTVPAVPTWEIPALETRIRVADDRSLVVTEAVFVNFGRHARPGITRALPRRAFDDRYGFAELDVEVVGVETGQGDPVPYRVRVAEHTFDVEVGDPAAMLLGEVAFVIEYRVAGAITHAAGRDHLRWPVAGGEWDAQIFGVETTVELPPDVDSETVVTGSYTGFFDERGRAADVAIAEPERIVFRLVRGLRSYERFVVDASWDAAGAPDPVSQTTTGRPMVAWLVAGIGLVALLLVLIRRASS